MNNAFKSALVCGLSVCVTLAAIGQTNLVVTTNNNVATNAIAVDRPDEHLSTAAREIVKLADSGTSHSDLLTEISKISEQFALSSEDVIYLRDLGLESDVITAMLEHDRAAMDVNTNAVPEVAATTNAPVVADTSSYVSETPPQDVQPFYSALSPYGTWLDVNGSWAWQPNVVVTEPAWQPYCDAGRWVWSDCGWYWASDYSWGWAPFHYGRWWRSPQCGWVWYPGTTWAPSWVTWRTYGDFCGWAPLPPNSIFIGSGFTFDNSFVGFNFGFALGPECFTFVDFPHFLHHDFHHHHLDHAHVNQFFHHSHVVNDFALKHNNVVVNNGVPPDRVREATGNRFHTVPVVDSTHGRSVEVMRNGRTVAVMRTPLLTTPATEPAVAQRLRPGRPVDPAVPNRLAKTPAPTTSVQNGPPLWTRHRTLSPNERQLWNNNFAGERSLTLPAQQPRTSELPVAPPSRELPNRGAAPEIHEASGARTDARPRQSPGISQPRLQFRTPSTHATPLTTPAPTEVYRSQPQAQPSTGPVHITPRSGDTFVAPNHSAVHPTMSAPVHVSPGFVPRMSAPAPTPSVGLHSFGVHSMSAPSAPSHLSTPRMTTPSTESSSRGAHSGSYGGWQGGGGHFGR